MGKCTNHPPTRWRFHRNFIPHMWEMVGILPRLLKPFFQYLTIFSNGKHFSVKLEKRLNLCSGRKFYPRPETCFKKWVDGQVNKSYTYKLMLIQLFYPSHVRNGGHLTKAIYASFRCKPCWLFFFGMPIFYWP